MCIVYDIHGALIPNLETQWGASCKKTYLLLRGLPFQEIGYGERLLVMAAGLKANHPISVADAWIAATAFSTNTTLVHKDPEMENLADIIKMKALPYK